FFSSQDQERASIRARRMRTSLLIKSNEFERRGSIKLKITGYVYYRVSLGDDGEKGWKRKGFSFSENISVDDFIANGWQADIDLDFSSLCKKINQDSIRTYDIPEGTWKAKVSMSGSDFSDDSSVELKILRFDLTNKASEDPRKGKRFDKNLFNCKYEVDLGEIRNEEFKDEYMYEGFKQRYYYDFRTINCQAYWLNERKTIFSTRHYDLFNQPNIIPAEKIEGVDVTFSILSGPDGISELEKLLEEMKSRKTEYESRLPSTYNSPFQQREENREKTWIERENNIKHFGDIIELFEQGIKILNEDGVARESFLKMNETFSKYYESKGILGASWRIFQIVFIVAGLRSIIEKKDFETVDVLHVGTGGGKSEAYFGLVVLALFYERVTGKTSGVTAIVKFPLRMLSIQQLERLSSVLIFAEETRKKYEELFGGSEFSLGYYVGSSTDDFPDMYYKLKRKLYKDEKYKESIKPGPESKIISKCPLCTGKEKGVVRLVDDPTRKRIVHVCDKNHDHIFHIYLSDREVFRFRPSVIVSTVDKWAGLSSQRRARTLLGCKGSICPNGHGFIPSGEQCEDNEKEGICEEIGKNEETCDGPLLSIQDEMHLLREGFGTISSHFEGLIETIVRSNSGVRGLKHVVMSATLNGTEKQIYELYNKGSIILPGPSPEGFGSSRDFFYDHIPGEKRLIYGLKPNLRDNHYATLRTLRHVCEFLHTQQKRFLTSKSGFLTEYGFKDEKEALIEFKKHLIPLTYHPKVQDAEDMDRFSDTVINDYLTSASIAHVRGTVLTGGRGLDELKYIINKVREIIEDYEINEQINPTSAYSPLFATSVVSHGVDLEELNIMVFQGIPNTTSEYIQALSRVGRKYRGIVLLWFYPNRVRDDSFFRNFKRYHDSLDHQVRPVPINRNARLGTMQTINSLFCAGILQHLSEIEGTPLYHKKDLVSLNSSIKELLVQFIRDVYGKPVEINVEEEVETRWRQIIHDSDSRDNDFIPKILERSGSHYFKNQTGMRGIQKQLVLTTNDDNKIKLIRGGG
ncbi:MAG: DEAD/DEAH box helicase, partial [Kosmotogaceae bacterium]